MASIEQVLRFVSLIPFLDDWHAFVGDSAAGSDEVHRATGSVVVPTPCGSGHRPSRCVVKAARRRSWEEELVFSRARNGAVLAQDPEETFLAG